MKIKFSKKNEKGFVALVLILIVSGFITTFVFYRSLNIALFFDQVQRKEFRLLSYYSAYNCIDYAILNLAKDYFYEISSTIEIPDLHCLIDIVKDESGYRLISVRGNYKNIYIKRSAVVRLLDNTVDIVSIN